MVCKPLRGSFAALLALALLSAASARCPFQDSQPAGRDRLLRDAHDSSMNPSVPEGGYDAVKQDIKAVLTKSRNFWPADFGNYGPLFIRLAWHCSGSYRLSDGRGGCDGGRIRFNPEHSWPDNTNLDKALELLEPIKLKYGSSLSWGDLIVLTGTTAIESMGGPVLGFCGGRIDDSDGYDSLELGPTPEQEAIAPCKVNGQCKFPLGPTTVGLIYVNPEGPMGEPDPAGSAKDIRSSFSRMGWSDEETVALIGGGHAFGKTHGACPTGPGPDPTQDPSNPWPGTCGKGPMKGKGDNTFTSGFEGPWTTAPTTWDNEYFTNLLEYDWEKHTGPGGHFQWRPISRDGGPVDDIMMLTSDVALLHDDSYLAQVHRFANNPDELADTFSRAWYKLTSSDMGPVTRCLGDDVPPPQPFQMPLPPTPAHLANFALVRKKVKALLHQSAPGADASPDGTPYFGALFVHLAYQCASTFRATDHRGGCNGARIRFSPQKDWPANAGMDSVLKVLADVKSEFDGRNGALSWADLIVLAGQTALEEAGSPAMTFCGGRVDADNGDGTEDLAPRVYSDVIVTVRDNMKVMGLTPHEAVALAGRLRSPMQQKRMGFHGSYTTDPSLLSNKFYKLLLSEHWVAGAEVEVPSDREYRARGKQVYVTAADLALVWDPEFKAIVQEYAADSEAFKSALAAAWSKLMNADRFDGPVGTVCK